MKYHPHLRLILINTYGTPCSRNRNRNRAVTPPLAEPEGGSHPGHVLDSKEGALGGSDSDFDVQANDPDAIKLGKSGPPEISYFFEKTKEFHICKFCR